MFVDFIGNPLPWIQESMNINKESSYIETQQSYKITSQQISEIVIIYKYLPLGIRMIPQYVNIMS